MKAYLKFAIILLIVAVVLIITTVPKTANAIGVSETKIYQMDCYGEYDEYGYYYNAVFDSNWGAQAELSGQHGLSLIVLCSS